MSNKKLSIRKTIKRVPPPKKRIFFTPKRIVVHMMKVKMKNRNIYLWVYKPKIIFLKIILILKKNIRMKEK